jgi:Ca2+-binding EF-hand superfamily protein
VKNLEIEDIEMLDYEFNQIDTDGSGFIEASGLKTAFDKCGEKLPSSKIDKIIKELDFADN